MSFNFIVGGPPAEVAEKLHNPEAWYRQPSCRGGAEAADFVASVVERVTDPGKTVTAEASGHVDAAGASVTMTVKTYS